MLREAHELAAQGRDVVVAYVETYGRPRTVELTRGLEVIPRRKVPYRGIVLEEMDLEAVLARRPEVALVDELAHTNVPGLRHAKRWQDVEALRDAGIDVISTVNVQHLESVKDLVEKVTGAPVRETLPDRVLDDADVIQFIDIAPEALLKRMRHGNVYPAGKVDDALAHFFRPRNLAALREIGLRVVADSMARHRQVVGAPEDVLVAISCGPSSEDLMRRGARLARRTGGSCVVVTVQPAPELEHEQERLRGLAQQLGCAFAVLGGRDIPGAILQAARDVGAEHVVVGEGVARGILSWLRPSLADRIIDGSPESDVHVIARRPALEPGQGPAPGEEERRPDPIALLHQISSIRGRRAMLRVYLGYALGCGTTTAMLDEARRRAGRGTDVVVAAYRLHDDPRSCLAGLEVLGRPCEANRERPLDANAVQARNPQVVCIDDLTVPDVHGRPALESVPALLQAGVTVLATFHLTSLRSAAQAVSNLIGRPLPGPVVEDHLLDAIDEFELIDVPPDELICRIRQRGLLPPARLAMAMQGELRPEVLTMLREMLLRLCADRVDRQLVGELRTPDSPPLRVREHLVLCLPPRAGLEDRVRATAKYAQAHDATFAVVSVLSPWKAGTGQRALDAYRSLVDELQGEFICLRGHAVAPLITRLIRESLATEVVLGRRRRGWRPWGLTARLIRQLQGVDLHVLRPRG